jgi:hypothetical protein
MEQKECSETSAYKLQTPRNYPKESNTRLPACEDGTESVPKRRHINFRRRGITQKKATHAYLPVKMEQKECSETSAYKPDAGELPKRKHTTFRTRRKFEIRKT